MSKVMSKKTITSLLLAFALVLTLPFTVQAIATESSGSTETGQMQKPTQNQHVYDNAGLLSTSEKESLEQMCIKKSKESGIEIMLLTNDDPNSLEPVDYIEKYEDQLPKGDRVYTLIDMFHRTICVEGYGSAETYINSDKSQSITDKMVPYVQEKSYYDAFTVSINKSVNYIQWAPQNLAKNIWIHLLISLIIGGVVVGIMAYNSGGKMTTNSNTYMDNTHSGLIGRRDDYLHTQVTRVRKPQNNGGGGGGVSPGGRSHSTGSSSF